MKGFFFNFGSILKRYPAARPCQVNKNFTRGQIKKKVEKQGKKFCRLNSSYLCTYIQTKTCRIISCLRQTLYVRCTLSFWEYTRTYVYAGSPVSQKDVPFTNRVVNMRGRLLDQHCLFCGHPYDWRRLPWERPLDCRCLLWARSFGILYVVFSEYTSIRISIIFCEDDAAASSFFHGLNAELVLI